MTALGLLGLVWGILSIIFYAVLLFTTVVSASTFDSAITFILEDHKVYQCGMLVFLSKCFGPSILISVIVSSYLTSFSIAAVP